MPIPDHIDIFHLTREMPASDKTALQCVMEVDEERVQLERLAESLAHCEDDGQFFLVVLARPALLKLGLPLYPTLFIPTRVKPTRGQIAFIIII